ncbi:MAG TPA: hypothetical protein VN728_02955 [Stellaceae bacterium]|jgi:hypothetical protein|nr:hypothetical protein [Stellaceae bacterium]
MPVDDERNTLQIGPPQREGHTAITQSMADAVRRRIEAAGGELAVWAVLREDVYETRFGDGFYLHVAGLALNSEDAHALAALAGDSPWVRWHVKAYQLGLAAGRPAFLRSWPKEEEFTIADFVEILAGIPPGKACSKLCTGVQLYRHGPFIELPAK